MFTTQYPFRCGGCNKPYEAGTAAVYVGTMLVSTEDGCVGVQSDRNIGEDLIPDHPVMPRGKTAADRCGRCFMVHASGQKECE